MYKINFYQDAQGRQSIKEYLDALQAAADSSKDSRIKLKKIYESLEVLALTGTRAGIPYVKHIQDDLWELRPLRDRIFFFLLAGRQAYLASPLHKANPKNSPPRN